MPEDIDKKKAQLSRVRKDFQRELQVLSHTFSSTSSGIREAARQVTLKEQFRQNFWATTGACVGVGLIASRIFASKRVQLSQSSVDYLAAQIADKILQNSDQLTAEAQPQRPPKEHSLGQFAMRLLMHPLVTNAMIGTVTQRFHQDKSPEGPAANGGFAPSEDDTPQLH